mmetsp:Transcript_2095/g.7244  ORF Transcript_2095/g.7244 Transcript_2095/m.7244 type:complete len:166 (-) Transcript_2095:1612-2109(-)
MFALRRAASRAVAARGSFHPSRTALRAFANQCPHDPSKPYHKSPLSLESSGGLLEYSVVYTDRAMNHMSKPFCKVRMVGWGGQARDVRHTSRVLRNGRKKERDKPVLRLGSGPRARAPLAVSRKTRPASPSHRPADTRAPATDALWQEARREHATDTHASTSPSR